MPPRPALARVYKEFTRLHGGEPRMFRAPARINLIGEHLDYNGGQVFPAAANLFTWVAASPRQDRVLDIHLCNDGSRHRIELGALSSDGSGGVVEYLKGVAWSMQREGLDTAGCNLVIGGDIPLGGGLSSSASLELALAAALADRVGLSLEAERLALLCHRAEVEFVGVQCGIMDQYAVALGARGHAMLLNCRNRDYELVALPDPAGFIVVHCGVSRRLPAGGYNSRREECAEALALLRKVDPGLGFLADLQPATLDRHRDRLGEPLFRRCRHIVSESQRVRDAVAAVRSGDLERLGALMNASHDSLRDDYEVSCPELDTLVEIAIACDSVLGARMMGAGFGGCALVLARRAHLADAVARIRQEYGRVLGREPWLHAVGPADPVGMVEERHESR